MLLKSPRWSLLILGTLCIDIKRLVDKRDQRNLVRFIGIQPKKVINENSIITEVPINTVKKYYKSTNRCITAKKPLLTKKY